MELTLSPILSLLLTFLLLFSTFSDCYDPLDPNGNITIIFDILQFTPDSYQGRVSIRNYQQYRHVDVPGWKIGWRWKDDEVIWSMSGAFATKQGNCSDNFNYQQTPHSCDTTPTIMDLMPDAPPENKSEDCCRGGALAAWAINPNMSFSSFEITVGNLTANTTAHPPENLTFMAPGPGYTCDLLQDVEPSVYFDVGGKRQVHVKRTWKSTCTYSSFVANKSPTCCVSLSTFYNPTVTPCPNCSCGCRDADPTTLSCISGSFSLQTLNPENKLDIVKCTNNMCPIRIHWHVKNNYMTHWRIKLTISNYNYMRNYSDWNLLVQHPAFNQSATIYSFNSTLLPSTGFSDIHEVALFWGINFYNSELLSADESKLGSVSTDILLEKNLDVFTFTNGWAFPRRIYFNGENCVLSLPDNFPILPNGIFRLKSTYHHHFLVLVIHITLVILLPRF